MVHAALAYGYAAFADKYEVDQEKMGEPRPADGKPRVGQSGEPPTQRPLSCSFTKGNRMDSSGPVLRLCTYPRLVAFAG